MVLMHLSDEGPDRHDLGTVTVHPDAAAAAKAPPGPPDEEGLIPFLKEQQWRVPFATTEAVETTLQPRVRAWATVVPRSSGEARITAPASGRLLPAEDGRYALGATLEQGATVAFVAQALTADGDPASLDLAIEKARLARSHARKERERLEELAKAGAVPERRVGEARLAEEQASAELRAAERRRQQQQRARGASGAGVVAVSAPIGGVITGIDAPIGVLVEQGQPLAWVVDLSAVHVEVRVPEANLPALGQPRGVALDLVGLDEELSLAPEQLVAGGGIVDPATRTVPYLFAVDNTDGRLRLGMTGSARLAAGDPIRAVAVPASAIIVEGGMDVVFVLAHGEAFERRIVQTGVRDKGMVAVTSGLEPGERVVSKGAWLVKLAATASSMPAHGHAH
jgi:RND family efflux transporter MFP subunit